MKFCSRCGAVIDYDYASCHNCGKPIFEDIIDNNNKPYSKNKIKNSRNCIVSKENFLYNRRINAFTLAKEAVYTDVFNTIGFLNMLKLFSLHLLVILMVFSMSSIKPLISLAPGIVVVTEIFIQYHFVNLLRGQGFKLKNFLNFPHIQRKELLNFINEILIAYIIGIILLMPYYIFMIYMPMLLFGTIELLDMSTSILVPLLLTIPCLYYFFGYVFYPLAFLDNTNNETAKELRKKVNENMENVRIKYIKSIIYAAIMIAINLGAMYLGFWGILKIISLISKTPMLLSAVMIENIMILVAAFYSTILLLVPAKFYVTQIKK